MTVYTPLIPSISGIGALRGWHFRDISLFLAWHSSEAIQAATLPKYQVEGEREQRFSLDELPLYLTLWSAKRIAVSPTTKKDEWFTEEDLARAVVALADHANHLLLPGTPRWAILHIGQLQSPGLLHLPMKIRDLATEEPRLSSAGLRALLDHVATITSTLMPSDVPSDVTRLALFDHYSRSLHRRGIVVLDNRVSLMSDQSLTDVLLLLQFAQQAGLTTSGITQRDFDGLSMRVSLWDSNADQQAMHDDMIAEQQRNAISNRASVLLNLVLSSIGTVLAIALSSSSHLSLYQLRLPLAAFIVAALIHAIAAMTQRKFFDYLGYVLIGVALVGLIYLLVQTGFLQSPTV